MYPYRLTCGEANSQKMEYENWKNWTFQNSLVYSGHRLNNSCHWEKYDLLPLPQERWKCQAYSYKTQRKLPTNEAILSTGVVPPPVQLSELGSLEQKKLCAWWKHLNLTPTLVSIGIKQVWVATDNGGNHEICAVSGAQNKWNRSSTEVNGARRWGQGALVKNYTWSICNCC